MEAGEVVEGEKSGCFTPGRRETAGEGKGCVFFTSWFFTPQDGGHLGHV